MRRVSGLTGEGKDIHKVRYFSSLITICDGKVIKITKPSISHCPLAGFLYKGLKKSDCLSVSRLKEEIRKVIEWKITEFGFCSKDRVFWAEEASVPYGASEIMAHALKIGVIDSAVMVCDGAGTVVVPFPQLAQGIGARMHSVIRTSAIPEVVEGLRRLGCRVISDDGVIDQEKGVREAAKEGCKKIAVTVNAYRGESLKDIRELERRLGVSVIILVVCATGIGSRRTDEIGRYADMVWTCRSAEVRNRLFPKALEVLSDAAPVYVLTEKGRKLVYRYLPAIFSMRKARSFS
ncbi:MAG: DUF2099 family protein [Candidatus Omnitrophica bacterium]|nr:DUF2099 family protein [Candidatus Omnitrophota bacterium]